MLKTKIFTIFLLIIMFLTISTFYAKGQQMTYEWVGNWYLPSETVSFDLFITIDEDEMKGAHCWTDPLSLGEECTPSNKFSLTNPVIINNETIEFTFRTYYGMGAESDADYFGKVQLTLQDENTLLWKITEEPDGRTIIPEELTLERYQE